MNEFSGLKLVAKTGAPMPSTLFVPSTFMLHDVWSCLGVVLIITAGNLVLSVLATLLIVRFRKNL